MTLLLLDLDFSPKEERAPTACIIFADFSANRSNTPPR